MQIQGNDVLLPTTPDFSLSQTLDCGQAFRWKLLPDGSFRGIVSGHICHIAQKNETIILYDSAMDFNGIWRDYFDLNRDYSALKKRFSIDPTLAYAIAYAPGIRVLRQEPWETLCSFIISQNNNVPRIKGIIERLCEQFGEPLGEDLFAFPTPQLLACLTPEDLAPLRAGFRARYLIDAAQRVSSGEVVLSTLTTLPLSEARVILMKILGVGIKVADCTLLYGCGQVSCVPVDVWVRRVLNQLYPDGLPACTQGAQGIAQQYLFHCARTCPTFLPKI